MHMELNYPYFRPKFVEYTGLSTGVEYKCGACDAGTTATCQDCVAEATACNKAKETGTDFKCKDWEWKEADSKFVLKTTSTTCKRLKDTAVKCNM